MSRQILIRPVVTEKSTKMMDKLNTYSFVVDRKANKVEIKKAVELKFNVQVSSVNTTIVPAKMKTMFRSGKMSVGRKAGYKKAYVRLAAGESIEIFKGAE